MKKRKSFLLLFPLLLTACGNVESATDSAAPVTNSTASPASDSTTVQTTDYYLAGSLGIDGKQKFEYDATNKTYQLTGVSLKRGDTFTILGNNGATAFEFDDLSDNANFDEGKNGYIYVVNEGIYTISLVSGKIVTTKTGSNYQTVKLVYASKNEIDEFTMNEDFTFSLEGSDIRYREKFYIDLDGDTLGFDDAYYNNAYYDAFRFGQDGSIEMILKGKFDFKIDFSLNQPLVITSEDMREPNFVPEDADDYRDLVDQIKSGFKNNGQKYTATKEVKTASDGKTLRNDYTETLDLNQHYLKTETYTYDTDQTKEGAITPEAAKEDASINEKEAVFNDDNYFEISLDSGKSTPNNTVNGYKIVEEAEEPETQADDTESTIVTAAKSTKTTVEAEKSMLAYKGEHEYVESILNFMTKQSHVSSYSTRKQTDIDNSLTINGAYNGEFGDSLTVTFTNWEAYYASYGTSEYAYQTLTLTLNEEGNIDEGTYTCKKYQGSGSTLFKDSSTYTLGDDYESLFYSETTYSFEMKYEDRQKLDTFKLDIDKYIAKEIDVAASKQEFSCLKSGIDAGTLGLQVVEPITALDAKNFQITSYDSEYFSKDYSGSLSGRGKRGETKVTVGNLYNDVSYEVTLDLVYADYTSNSQLGEFRVNDKKLYTVTVGQTYDVTIAPYSGYDPYLDISVSDTEAATISDVCTEEEAHTNGYMSFKLTINKSSSSLSLIAKPHGSAKYSYTQSITVIEPWTEDAIVGAYSMNYWSTYKDQLYILKLNKGGNGSAKVYDAASTSVKDYDFKWTFDEGGNISLAEAGTEVTALTGTMGSKTTYTSEAYDRVQMDSVAITINGTVYGSYGSTTTLYTVTPMLAGMDYYTITDSDGKAWTLDKVELDSGNSGYIYLTDGTTTCKFQYKGAAYASGTPSAMHYYADSSSSSYTSYYGSVTCSSGVITIAFSSYKTFIFTPKA